MHTALLEHFVVICCHVHHKILGWSPCFANRKYAAPWNFMINTNMPTWCVLIQLYPATRRCDWGWATCPSAKRRPTYWSPTVAKNATASWIIQQTMCTEAPQPANNQNCPVQVEYWTLTRTTTPTWPMSSWLALNKHSLSAIIFPHG